MPDLGRRIIIVGLPGSGKSSLAEELSSLLDTPRLSIGIDRLLLDRQEDGRHRITAVGLPGSSDALIGALTSRLNLPRTTIQIDRLLLDRRGDRGQEEIDSVLSDVARENDWIAEGRWFRIPGYVWNRATTIIWLDPPRLVLAWRLLRRGWSMKLIWGRVFWGDLKYTLLQHPKGRDTVRRHVEDGRGADTNVVVIRTRRDLSEFMQSATNGPGI